MDDVIGVGLIFTGISALFLRIPDRLAKYSKDPLIWLYSHFYDREKLEKGFGEGLGAMFFRFGLPAALVLAGVSLIT